MLEQFLVHIRRHNLFSPSDRILLAVSGGVDSMVMAHLFLEAGLATGVAHCNFQLRDEADGDEDFVRSWCSARSIPFHTIRFDTRGHASARGQSIQLAARELRYRFFDDTLRSGGYAVVATAHHLTDSIETVILHLARGTGIDGMTGIPVRHGRVVRPLLFASRFQLEGYAQEKGVAWREDASNAAVDYDRNLVRHRVLPVLRELNPRLEEGFSRTSERLEATRAFARNYLRVALGAESGAADQRIPLEPVLASGHPAAFLWETVKHLGFSYDQCRQIVQSTHPGRSILSPSHRLTLDRGEYLVSGLADPCEGNAEISGSDRRAAFAHLRFEAEILARREWDLDPSPEVAQLDLDRLVFPLSVRRWQPGDQFVPLGMSHPQKVSDYLINNKVPLPHKERVCVLLSGNDIAWLIGFRVDDRYKVAAATRFVYRLRVDESARRD